ncbi:MAG: acyltransferase family protein [Candidatus Bathyarchaeota archaeon]|nr:acyltransferase family protein [Candidatus Bathyarchaeota archaeon]
MENLNRLGGREVYVDLIRTVAMFSVILLHAAGQWIVTSQEMNQMPPLQLTGWAVVGIYQTIGVMGVPLFLMLTGALLLQPEKKESLRVFFKKRWARIGLPALFWSVAYFLWDFLVQNIPFSFGAVLQGILNGPYTQMWYLYVLIGCYLLTPILRIIIANADQTMIKYFIALWVLGVAIIPFLNFLSVYKLNSNVFALTGYFGFFVLGIYLTTVRVRRSILWGLLALGVALTAIGTYVLAVNIGGENMYFFQEYFSPTTILVSVTVFLLLLTISPPSAQHGTNPSKLHKLIGLISENTLGIFFIHVMIIESIQRGYLGFAINRDLLNPVIEVPLLTAITLFISLAIVLLLKKVPYLKKLIG